MNLKRKERAVACHGPMVDDKHEYTVLVMHELSEHPCITYKKSLKIPKVYSEIVTRRRHYNRQ